jgi:UDP-glucose 4-epimerase
MKEKNKYILVTGGLGYIGSNTVVSLIENGYTPIILDNLSNGLESRIDEIKKITKQDVIYFYGDIRDCKGKNNVAYIMKNFPIYAVIHFAAYKSVNESVKDPIKYYDNNIKSTIDLLNHMKEYGVKNIIFSSSCTVYGEPDSYPVTELSPIKKAETPYGETKQICESILENSSCENLNVVSLRYFNPIGSHKSGMLSDNPKGIPENLMPYILRTIKGEFPHLRVFGNDYNTEDGTAIRDYINITDLANAHVKALSIVDREKFNAINVGSGNGYSILEIIEAFKRSGVDVPYQFYPRRDGDIEKIYGDISKAKKLMNWEPKKTIEDTVKSIIKTVKE